MKNEGLYTGHFTNIKWDVGKERWIKWVQGNSMEAGRELNNQCRYLCHEASLPSVPMLLTKKEKRCSCRSFGETHVFWLTKMEVVQVLQQRSSSRQQDGQCGLSIPPLCALPDFPFQRLILIELKNVTWFFAIKFWYYLILCYNVRSEEGRRVGVCRPSTSQLHSHRASV